MKKNEIKIVLVVMILLGIVSFGLYAFRSYSIKQRQEAGNWVYIQRGNEVIAKYDIDVDGYYEVTGEYGTFRLQVEGGRYRAINVDCPNKNCEGFGWVKKGSSVVIQCLPNNIIVYQ